MPITGAFAAVFAALLLGMSTGAADVPARRAFFETLVQLTIGVLFVSISATVTPRPAGKADPPALTQATDRHVRHAERRSGRRTVSAR